MKKREKKIILVGITSFLCIGIAVGGIFANRYWKRNNISEDGHTIEISNTDIPLSFGTGKLVEQTEADVNIIPDKYNSGCSGNLTKVEQAGTYSGVEIKISGANFAIDFVYSNKKKSGEIKITNLDFSDKIVCFINEDKIDRDICVVFENCKFSTIKSAKGKSDKYSYCFNNCSINQFSGSNAIFERCYFGGSYSDGINPYQNVHAYFCYFADMASNDSAGNGLHTDGVQIFANQDYVAEDISFEHCRFETPQVQTTGSTAYVNSCFSLGIEYNDAKNIHVDDCIMNGGGYSIYATKKLASFSLEDISISNVHVGAASLYGNIYPTVAEEVALRNIVDTDSLYVSSVWQDEKGTHIITTNDTRDERVLKVVTSNGEYSFTVSACIGGSDLKKDNWNIPFENFPFDQDIVIPGKIDYVICYDVTNVEKQIRMVSFNNCPIYINDSVLPEQEELVNEFVESSVSVIDLAPNEIEEVSEVVDVEEIVYLQQGVCSDGIDYYVSPEGILSINGAGEIPNYNSKNNAPWYNMATLIRGISISEGITRIGAQSFRDLSQVTYIFFPDSVKAIGPNACIGCINLCEISLPREISAIGDYAFWNCGIEKVSYRGSVQEWDMVNVGENNTPLLTADFSCEIVETSLDDEDIVILSGACGDEIMFELHEDGSLVICGNGKTYDYSSANRAPWFDYKDEVSSIIVNEGITYIGAQSFREFTNLEEVVFPNSLAEIGPNSFINCKKLTSIYLNENIQIIGQYAFHGTALSTVYYKGNEFGWNNVSVGSNNGKIGEIVEFID